MQTSGRTGISKAKIGPRIWPSRTNQPKHLCQTPGLGYALRPRPTTPSNTCFMPRKRVPPSEIKPDRAANKLMIPSAPKQRFGSAALHARADPLKQRAKHAPRGDAVSADPRRVRIPWGTPCCPPPGDPRDSRDPRPGVPGGGVTRSRRPRRRRRRLPNCPRLQDRPSE